ncbi:hypothetical protein PI125_g18326 [Phytophthora idaei]|nr:hypothetical protein PI125_g18326 [Phytophthora idaei]
MAAAVGAASTVLALLLHAMRRNAQLPPLQPAESMGYHVNCVMSAREAASVATNASTASLRLA